MLVVDAHQDIAYNALCFGRDYRTSALRKRQLEVTSDVPQANGQATIGLPESIAGRVAVVFATVFVAPRGKNPAPWSALMYDDAAEAYQLGMRQLDYYEKIADEDDRLQLIHNTADLDAVLATWEPGKTLRDRRQGLVLLIENADPIREPKAFEDWYERGVRLVGPAWRASRYTGGTGEPGPLTEAGKQLLEVMSSYNAILDLSHMAEQAYFQALELYEGPIIASHSNPRRFCDTDRHLSDEMIRQLGERDGVIGVVLYNRFLHKEWTKSDGKGALTLRRVADAIDYICQLTGSAQHVGIGTDFDGGFGAESIPLELDTVADLLQIGDILRDRGFTETDVEAVLSNNMLRKLREGLQ